MSEENQKNWADTLSTPDDSDSEVNSESEAAEVKTEPEPQGTEPGPQGTEPEPQEDITLENGIYKAKLLSKNVNESKFEITIDEFACKAVAPNGAHGYFQIVNMPIGQIVNVEIKLDDQNMPIVIWIEGCEQLVHNGKIFRLYDNSDNFRNSFAFGSVLVKNPKQRQNQTGIYIPESIVSMDDTSEFIFSKLNRGMFIQFSMKSSENPDRIYDYEMTKVRILEMKEGVISKLEPSAGTGEVKYKKDDGTAKTVSFNQKSIYSNYKNLSLLQDVRFIDDTRDNILVFITNKE